MIKNIIVCLLLFSVNADAQDIYAKSIDYIKSNRKLKNTINCFFFPHNKISKNGKLLLAVDNNKIYFDKRAFGVAKDDFTNAANDSVYWEKAENPHLRVYFDAECCDTSFCEIMYLRPISFFNSDGYPSEKKIDTDYSKNKRYGAKGIRCMFWEDTLNNKMNHICFRVRYDKFGNEEI